jgi:4-hydroxy-3-methylbut-2-enyl diphosphate reductase
MQKTQRLQRLQKVSIKRFSCILYFIHYGILYCSLNSVHIILANPRGFCAGVNMAVKALDAALLRFGTPMYVYHEIVHNTWVVNYFRNIGACFVDSIDEVPVGSRLMFSAHGVSPEVRLQALKRKIKTIDATCPLVSKVHRDVIRYASEGYTIILIGHRGHDEVNGTMNEAPESIRIVENEQEIETLSFQPDEKLVYLTQTTLSVEETANMIELLQQRFPNITGHSGTNICYATQNRQDAVRKLSIGSDVVLVVGSRTSSNSRRLAELAKSLGICSYLVDGPDDIETELFQGNETILITAGASAPERIVQDCVQVLQTRFQATVEEKTTCTESLAFRLPGELGE